MVQQPVDIFALDNHGYTFLRCAVKTKGLRGNYGALFDCQHFTTIEKGMGHVGELLVRRKKAYDPRGTLGNACAYLAG